MSSAKSILNKLADNSPLIRRADAIAAGVTSNELTDLTRNGTIQRIGRGLYQLENRPVDTQHMDLLEASIQQPKGVVCLLSALAFHGVGTHPAREVWLQLPINSPTPNSPYPPLRIIKTRLESAFTEGVETHTIEGCPIRITNLDRTIVDCFKHRSQVGLEVCLEALKERLNNRTDSLQKLHHYARLMRVSRVMQPYLEALT
jgi:predicted transcriptional regulator of viral defense system